MRNFYNELANDDYVEISEKEIVANQLDFMNDQLKTVSQNDDGSIQIFYDDWKKLLRILVSINERL